MPGTPGGATSVAPGGEDTAATHDMRPKGDHEGSLQNASNGTGSSRRAELAAAPLGQQAKDNAEAAVAVKVQRRSALRMFLRRHGEDEVVLVPAGQTCVICMEAYQPGEILQVLLCSHLYHERCIDQWLGNHTSCCVCKADLEEMARVAGKRGRRPSRTRSDTMRTCTRSDSGSTSDQTQTRSTSSSVSAPPALPGCFPPDSRYRTSCPGPSHSVQQYTPQPCPPMTPMSLAAAFTGVENGRRRASMVGDRSPLGVASPNSRISPPPMFLPEVNLNSEISESESQSESDISDSDSVGSSGDSKGNNSDNDVGSGGSGRGWGGEQTRVTHLRNWNSGDRSRRRHTRSLSEGQPTLLMGPAADSLEHIHNANCDDRPSPRRVAVASLSRSHRQLSGATLIRHMHGFNSSVTTLTTPQCPRATPNGGAFGMRRGKSGLVLQNSHFPVQSDSMPSTPARRTGQSPTAHGSRSVPGPGRSWGAHAAAASAWGWASPQMVSVFSPRPRCEELESKDEEAKQERTPTNALLDEAEEESVHAVRSGTDDATGQAKTLGTTTRNPVEWLHVWDGPNARWAEGCDGRSTSSPRGSECMTCSTHVSEMGSQLSGGSFLSGGGEDSVTCDQHLGRPRASTFASPRSRIEMRTGMTGSSLTAPASPSTTCVSKEGSHLWDRTDCQTPSRDRGRSPSACSRDRIAALRERSLSAPIIWDEE